MLGGRGAGVGQQRGVKQGGFFRVQIFASSESRTASSLQEMTSDSEKEIDSGFEETAISAG